MGKGEASGFAALDRSLRAGEPPPRPGILRTIAVYAVLLTAIFAGFGILFWLVGGRREVRAEPLGNPVAVAEVAADGSLLLEDGTRCRLAGVEWPANPIDPVARNFLRMAVRQGVEIVRKLDGDRCILLCEPRVFHWCGNDSVSAHYERRTLNELVVGFGIAKADKNAAGLRPDEAHGLSEYQRFAYTREVGLWGRNSGCRELRDGFDPEGGLNVSYARASRWDYVQNWNAAFRHR